MYKNICEKCGKEFFNKKKRKFCSIDCYRQYIKENPIKKEKHLVEVKCAECGKIEYVYESRAKKYLCCSVECLGKYNSKKYSKKVTLKCPICGIEYQSMFSKISHHRTCGKNECRAQWLKISRCGCGNSRYKTFENLLKLSTVSEETHSTSRNEYQHIVKLCLGLNSIKSLPKGYVIHHKDANHTNNNPENLIVLPKSTHRKIHTIFGNILINALHTNRISREEFFKICNKEQSEFYSQIIDLNVKHQVVVKQGELLESPEEDNQHPSLYRNIFEGSTTNERVLTGNTEDGNFDTSALPIINDNGDEIV